MKRLGLTCLHPFMMIACHLLCVNSLSIDSFLWGWTVEDVTGNKELAWIMDGIELHERILGWIVQYYYDIDASVTMNSFSFWTHWTNRSGMDRYFHGVNNPITQSWIWMDAIHNRSWIQFTIGLEFRGVSSVLNWHRVLCLRWHSRGVLTSEWCTAMHHDEKYLSFDFHIQPAFFW